MSFADNIFGSWINRDKLPQLRHQFEINRDPLRKLEIEAAAKTEKQRRDEDSSRVPSLITKDRPQLNMHPPDAMRNAVDRAMFNASWMREQRDAAYQAMQVQQEHQQQYKEQTYEQTHTSPHTTNTGDQIMSKQPLQTFKDGAVSITLWEQGNSEKQFATASIGKMYQDKRTGEWREGKSFSAKDMQTLQALLPTAHQELGKWNAYYHQLAQDKQQELAQSEPTQEPALKTQQPHVQPITQQSDMIAARDAAMQAAKAAPDHHTSSQEQEHTMPHTR